MLQSLSPLWGCGYGDAIVFAPVMVAGDTGDDNNTRQQTCKITTNRLLYIAMLNTYSLFIKVKFVCIHWLLIISSYTLITMSQ